MDVLDWLMTAQAREGRAPGRSGSGPISAVLASFSAGLWRRQALGPLRSARWVGVERRRRTAPSGAG